MDREWVTNVSVVLPDLNFAQGPAGRRGAGTHSMAPSISAPHWGQDGVICARASQRRSRYHDNNDHSTIASAPAPRRKPPPWRPTSCCATSLAWAPSDPDIRDVPEDRARTAVGNRWLRGPERSVISSEMEEVSHLAA